MGSGRVKFPPEYTSPGEAVSDATAVYPSGGDQAESSANSMTFSTRPLSATITAVLTISS